MSSSSPILSRNLKPLQRCIPPLFEQQIIVFKDFINLQENLHPTQNPPLQSHHHQVYSTDDKSSSKRDGVEEEEEEALIDSIKSFCRQGNLFNAFKAFSFLQLHVNHGDSSVYSYSIYTLHTISTLLLSCSTLKALPQGMQLHAHLINLGLEQNPVLVPKLVTFYSSFGKLIDAHIITENSNVDHSMPWNLLISAYVRNGFSVKAIAAYKQMVKLGFEPDNFTYPSLLKACGEEFDLGFGRELHRSIEDSHLEWSLFVHNALVSMYAKCGEMETAQMLFDKMPVKDVVSWNSILSGYASKNMWDQAFDLFERMGICNAQMNVVTWNTIAGGCLQMGNYKRALELISRMRSHEGYLDSVGMVIGLGASSRLGDVNVGKEIHGSAIRSHFICAENVQNALITMYSRCADLRHAYILFRSTKVKSLITWNSMIAGYSLFDRSEEASFIFRQMILSGYEPNYVTIASILPLCARVANLQRGKELHCYMIRHGGFKDYLLLWNSLVDMYSKSGKILEAKRLFDSMHGKDEVTYTSLIDGYGMQGEGLTALKLFEEMISFGIKPDHVTMVAVLSACSHSGLVCQGEDLFKKMTIFYGIRPRMEHFACMVDLFGRAGLLRKAAKFITDMPFQPSPAMWATLIGACQIHRNTDIGEWAAENLLETRPRNSGYYVLICNMYAAAKCWSKLAKVRILMRDLGVKKAPGCAWVDVGNGFHLFLVEDRSNPFAQEIYLLLDRLAKLMKEDGYVAIEDFGLADDEFKCRDLYRGNMVNQYDMRGDPEEC